MATMALEILHDGDVTPLRYSVQLDDADMNRISIAYAALLFPNGIIVTEATETEPATYRAPTAEEVLAASAMAMVKQMSDTAFQWHRKKAIREAEAATAPITITPAE